MAENENATVETGAPAITAKQHYGSKKRAKLIADIVTYIVLVFGAFIMLYPFWWMIIASFDVSTKDISDNLVWWPSADCSTAEFYDNLFEHYARLLEGGTDSLVYDMINVSFWRIIGNTLMYSIIPVVVGVVTSTSAAFAFAKIDWIGRDVVFLVLLSAIMIPGPSLMLIQYCMYSNWGWLTDGWMVMIIPGLFGSIMTAFFVRQFLFGMPTSIIEAAKIDGAGYWRIFWSFIMPLAMPAVMAQAILSFMGCWNNYMGCYVMLQSNTEWWNLPVLVADLSKNLINKTQSGAQYYGIAFAGAVMSVIPVLILFGVFQKQIMGSLMLTGSKE